MESFKYYKRGKGELDTSNFPAILDKRRVAVDVVDDKTIVSLLALNQYAKAHGKQVAVQVRGYIAHLRGDKDVYPVSQLYDLMANLDFAVCGIQHESTAKIEAPFIELEMIAENLGIGSDAVTFIGADASVPKFCLEIDCYAEKVRESGKVVGMDFDVRQIEMSQGIVIVDDILGGGATIQKLLDIIAGSGFQGPKHLWVAYNEGIHSNEFLQQFDSVFIGSLI